MIFFILSNDLIKIIIEYCVSLHKKIYNSKIIYFPDDEINTININDKYIFFGLHYVNYPIINKPNVYYINLEQLTINGKFSQYNMLDPLLNIIQKNNEIKICDYSQANISILKNYNFNATDDYVRKVQLLGEFPYKNIKSISIPKSKSIPKSIKRSIKRSIKGGKSKKYKK
jgi:hypothetical protein